MGLTMKKVRMAEKIDNMDTQKRTAIMCFLGGIALCGLAGFFLLSLSFLGREGPRHLMFLSLAVAFIALVLLFLFTSLSQYAQTLPRAELQRARRSGEDTEFFRKALGQFNERSFEATSGHDPSRFELWVKEWERLQERKEQEEYLKEELSELQEKIQESKIALDHV
ncbi:MAG: hypothetical protein ACQEP6_03345 [Patescibacteria group bacterium]